MKKIIIVIIVVFCLNSLIVIANDSSTFVKAGIGYYYDFHDHHQTGNKLVFLGMGKKMNSRTSITLGLLYATYNYYTLNYNLFAGHPNSKTSIYNNYLQLNYKIYRGHLSNLNLGAGLGFAFINRNEPFYNVRSEYFKRGDTLTQYIYTTNYNKDFNITKWSIPLNIEYEYRVNSLLDVNAICGYFFIPSKLESFGYGLHFSLGIRLKILNKERIK